MFVVFAVAVCAVAMYTLVPAMAPTHALPPVPTPPPTPMTTYDDDDYLFPPRHARVDDYEDGGGGDVENERNGLIIIILVLCWMSCLLFLGGLANDKRSLRDNASRDATTDSLQA